MHKEIKKALSIALIALFFAISLGNALNIEKVYGIRSKILFIASKSHSPASFVVINQPLSKTLLKGVAKYSLPKRVILARKNVYRKNNIFHLYELSSVLNLCQIFLMEFFNPFSDM